MGRKHTHTQQQANEDMRSTASYLACYRSSLSYHNTNVEADEELEQYGREDCADERPCHYDLLLRGARHVLRLTLDVVVIQAVPRE